ncbi:MAG TPA: fimbria/pilus periplasmic chaperone [Allosphingosinicella sp.]|nr:fimbria/pilus periplasmic chaperone [Allosphingosinicella sp.]
MTPSARAQGVGVSPVNLLMQPGQTAAALIVTNREDHRIAFQIRGYSWHQDRGGEDRLDPTDDLVASPPIASIEPGASQVVRLILRQPAGAQESTYRILFDQLPPPHEAGIVQILLRLSIPVFAEPRTPVAARMRWRIAREQGRLWLIAANDGTRHLTVANLQLRGEDGRDLRVDVNTPPHILAGGARRWPILTDRPISPAGSVRLTATGDAGTIDERISPDAGP